MSVYRSAGKRALDLLVAGCGLMVLSPLLAAIAATVLVCLGRPVLFRQQRPGLGGRPFTLFKFRTMTDARDAEGRLLSDGERLHPAGRLLRATSLDELPELVNVLRGEMSLVGPRPLLMSYLERYSPRQVRRHETPPGITGWAQINGRNDLDWAERFELDIWYVDHLSLMLDLKILLRTLSLVLSGRGVAAREHATMPEFKGNDT